MKSLLSDFEKYSYDVAGILIHPTVFTKTDPLPHFILEAYEFYKTNIHQKDYVLLVSRTDREISPATIRKHVDMVKEKLHEEVIYICPWISSYNRRRLIEYKVSFVVPGNQMYLPDLMIDLREHFLSERKTKNQFSPSTQAVILSILYHFGDQPFIPSQLAKQLGYSNMAMTRSFDEIESAGLGRMDNQGRQRRLWIQTDRRQFWKKTLSYLKTPVRQTIWLRGMPDPLQQVKAGQTALSHYTMLAPSKYVTFAVEKKDWDFYRRQHDIEELKFKEDADFQLQIWSYPPGLFAEGGIADKLSLYLSLSDNHDERIQGALETMMESIVW
jgi:DNA-binding MarR family transcriptional regulator